MHLLGLGAALALALLAGAASPLAAQEAPAATPEPAPFERDLGPSDAPLDAAPIAATLRPALDDFLLAEKSGAADPFGTEIPAQPAAPGPAIYLPLVGSAIQALPGPGEPPPDDPQPKGANVSVAVWPTPSIRVARGAILSYEIRLYNDGEGGADGVQLTMPFDPAQLTLVGSDLDRGAGDWVSAVRQREVVVSFGRLAERRQRVGYLYFRVGGQLPDNTVIGLRPAYRWSDARGTSERSANWAPVLAGGASDDGRYVWTIVQPVTGAATELRTFYSNRFAPGETVTAWLNAPSGVIALDLIGAADASGQVWLAYRPSRLAPASYQLVVYGTRSRLVGVATFIVR